MKKLFSAKFEGPYEASEFEPEVLKFWEEKKYSKARATKNKKNFVIATPPSNVTGELHIGHITPFTFIDIYGRYRRMAGDNVLLIPGTDHAAIAAQNVVEKELAQKGLSREKLGREKFLKEMWKFMKKYRPRIEKQMKMVGTSVDWSHNHFTMDEDLTRAVHEAFARLKKDKLIYQDEYLVNWCPRCGTALSDDEVEHKEVDTKLYWMKYGPIKLATTRPETKLGDTAVAVHPSDSRYKKYIGKTIDIQTVLGPAKIKIIADKIVDKDFGTGAVKVTPAHDPTDFELGKKHNLEFRKVIDEKGKMTKLCGPYAGMDRFLARKKIVEKMKKIGMLEKITDYKTRIPNCYRCNTVIEPLISKQWFIKIKPLAKLAMQAVKKGEIKIIPKNFEKIYFNWMENIHDWCISRQLWWGHQLPVWQCQTQSRHSERSEESQGDPSVPSFHSGQASPQDDNSKIKEQFFVSIEKPKECPICKKCQPKQISDVLDTWFSSALWPFAILGWPKKSDDFKNFYPTTMMITGYDILFFWVARMIMFGEYFTSKAPFDTVLLHGLILDKHGKKMSKSKGNVINPLPMIEKYGADALRMAVIIKNSLGNDVALSEEKIKAYRNFSNKIWNATRFVISNLEGFDPSTSLLSTGLKTGRTRPKLGKDELAQLEKLKEIIKETDEHFKKHRIALAAEKLYDFFWHYFCDKCIEKAKPLITNNQSPERKLAAQYTLYIMLTTLLKLLHPYIPFVTEACWQKIRKNIKNNKLEESIMIAKWPGLKDQKYVIRKKKVVRKIENGR